MLPPELQHRHVRYQPGAGADFTWEREWRVRTDFLEIEPAITTLVVPKREHVDRFKKSHWEQQQTNAALMGEVGWGFVQPLEWHYVVLEDLGISVEGWDPIPDPEIGGQ